MEVEDGVDSGTASDEVSVGGEIGKGSLDVASAWWIHGMHEISTERS